VGGDLSGDVVLMGYGECGDVDLVLWFDFFQILEATSNEPWGPHGTIMGDIAQATRNLYVLSLGAFCVHA
jgi:hypothetical protein